MLNIIQYLIHKNIMVSDGNLSAQDFAIFGIGNFKFLPIKNNQVVIGSLTSDSFYNQSISKLVKENLETAKKSGMPFF